MRLRKRKKAGSKKYWGEMSADYSGTPLARKLSLKDGQRVCFENMPDTVRAEIDNYGLALDKNCDQPDAVHLFVTRKARLVDDLTRFRGIIDQDGQIWVSWPKKASRVETDITEDTIREICLPMGLVDVKVCAVDAVWSGLKLVIRKELRKKSK